MIKSINHIIIWLEEGFHELKKCHFGSKNSACIRKMKQFKP